MSIPEVKTNDTGIDLSSADMPKPVSIDEHTPQSTPCPEAQAQIEPDPVAERDLLIASEDRVARRKMMMTVKRYYQSPRFGRYLESMDLVEDLDRVTLPEMTKLLGDIRFSVQNKNCGDMIQKGVPQIIAVAEPIITPFYDITGLAAILSKSPMFADLLEEVALENQMFTNTPPEKRLALEIVKTAFLVHEINAVKKAAAIVEKKVNVGADTADLMH